MRANGVSRSGRAVGLAMQAAGVLLAAVLMVGMAAEPLQAQSYPNQAIRMVLIFPPGGGVDTVGRIVAAQLTERLGVAVVPENRAGAGGNVGLEYTSKARPDGYTIVMGSETLSMSPSLYRKLSYDAIGGFAPITLVSEIPIMLLANPDFAAKDLKGLIEYAKANPGKVTYGTGGVGSAPHLAAELLKSLAGIDITHIPYKGVVPALTGMIGGEVHLSLLSPAAATPQVRAGKARALAVLGNKRALSLPDVPTAKEAANIDNLVVTGWYGVLAPGGTPRPIIDRLNKEINAIMGMPDTIEKIKKIGVEPLPGTTPEQFADFIKNEIARWEKVVKAAKIPALD